MNSARLRKGEADAADQLRKERRRQFLLAPIQLPVVWGRRSWGGISYEPRLGISARRVPVDEGENQ